MYKRQPLGRPTETEGLKKVCVVGGGVGCAIALPVAKELAAQGCEVTSIIGFRSKDLVILEDEFKAASKKFYMMTDEDVYKRQTNYILTKMAEENEDYAAALKEAQKLGYAEADPTNDVEGFDAMYKLSILSSLAFHTKVPYTCLLYTSKEIPNEKEK